MKYLSYLVSSSSTRIHSYLCMEFASCILLQRSCFDVVCSNQMQELPLPIHIGQASIGHKSWTHFNLCTPVLGPTPSFKPRGYCLSQHFFVFWDLAHIPRMQWRLQFWRVISLRLVMCRSKQLAKRNIDHPNFKNVNVNEASVYLQGMPPGEAIFRPSPKSLDLICLTMKVHLLFSHIETYFMPKIVIQWFPPPPLHHKICSRSFESLLVVVWSLLEAAPNFKIFLAFSISDTSWKNKCVCVCWLLPAW